MIKNTIPKFKNEKLLIQAFTHSSYINEHFNAGSHYERLEFLGDSIIEFVVRDLLYEAYPQMNEGEMSKLRIDLVNESRLANIAISMDIPPKLRLGVSALRERYNPRVLADAFEAFIGAYYLDTNIETVYQFAKSIFSPLVDKQSQTEIIDPISEFQQYTHKYISLNSPTYKLLRRVGSDHQPKFEIGVYVGDKLYGVGEGGSKKEAKKKAAMNALDRILFEKM